MTVPPLLRTAAPMGLALAAAALVLVTAMQLLPERVAVVHLRDGATGLAASRSDLVLIASSLLVGLVLAWLVTAAALAWTPARHLLVPHAAHWKAAPRRRELRLRLARWAARAFAAAVWFVTALVVLAIAGQGGGPLSAWWLPLVVSGLYVLVVLGGFAWAFGLGFRPDESAGPTASAAAARSGAAASAASPTPAPARRADPASRPAAPADRPGARAGLGSVAGPAAAPRATRPPPSTVPGRRPTTGRPAGGEPDGKGPPRPYQPRPTRPTRGGPPRG
ncbi:hypothetical protein IFT77_09205 [Frigoribacterium sp. CFBP 13729]|uniref:hypothetical protein n=1 Tax=Frigoribacterium sp. CFBP 13729 TaxID=2775293 RepID=UPI00178741E3|nr:hypothetical protein [Frigoribacterium sp. CFBP 13729]MBD8610662.1 hypothetical protein [Frigoribacterium sp. CFBP 13729]